SRCDARGRHSEWSTSPFRRVRETQRGRTAKGPTRLTRIRLRPIRSDRGSCLQHGLPSSAPFLSWCRAGAFHLQAQAEAQAAVSSASQDATRRSPAAIRSSRQGDRLAPYERAPRRFRQGLRSLKSVTERVAECRLAKRTRTVTVRPGRDFARSLLATLSAR